MVDMVAFTEDEQLVMDLTWYAVDAEGRIGHFTTGGGALLPPSIAKSKETLEMVDNYFSNLPILQEKDYMICRDLPLHMDMSLITNMDGYIKPSAEMSVRGLYSFDNHPVSNERPYFRVTIPRNVLFLDDLPEEMKNIMKDLRLDEISFAEASLIPEDVVSKL